jgi:oligopeptide/dipeptide ABC transporter ATP-binding protein
MNNYSQNTGIQKIGGEANDIVVIENLKTYFPLGKNKFVRAVNGVSLTIKKGEVFGLVGESGSGKTTIAFTFMGMYKETGGNMYFRGEEISNKRGYRNMAFKKNAQIVFQDPGSSLNPYHDVRKILSLPLLVHKIVNKKHVDQKILEILDMVELPSTFLRKTPNSIGGGEKQLVAIARALCSSPHFIILDEPTSSLDVSIQAKIIGMLLKLHKEQNLTYMLITHDLSLMRNIATRVAIMYLGEICEIAPTIKFYESPMHPYTQMLLSSIPVVSEADESLKPKKVISRGEIPSPVNVPKGCSFHTRCNRKMDICCEVKPQMYAVSEDHFVRCHLYDKDLFL